MKHLISVLYFCLLGLISLSGQVFFPGAAINDSLLEGSDAVVRFHRTNYVRKSRDVYFERVHFAVTVLNDQGKNAASLMIHYDRNSEVIEVGGSVYNAVGLTDSKLKKKNIRDYPSNASYTLFSDQRVMTYSPAINGYPFTVEYDYKIRHKGVVGFSTWMPYGGFDIAVEKARLEIETPSNLSVRYRALNYDFDFSADTAGQVKRYCWSVGQMKALEYEPDLPHYLDCLPAVFLSPLDISYEGTNGSFRNWNTYGKWVYGLIAERDQLSEETAERMTFLVDTIADTLNKVEAIYKYMQENTRYVNVSLGIGGFQPLYAYEVDEKGYGDCKALCNYTKALLKAVGITSYYAEIGSGSSRELKFPDFASINQTNHIILCVPLERDTVWLECTSQTIPFGYIGASNSNRLALLITEDGGVLARTPVYSSKDNLRSSVTNMKVDETGNVSLAISSDFYNTEYEDIDRLLHLSPKEQREALLKFMPLEGFTMVCHNLEEETNSIPRARISLEGRVVKMARKAGSRLLLKPEFIFSQTSFKNISDERELDFYRALGYHHVDSISLILPEGFRVEQHPEDVLIQSIHGNYKLSYKVLEGEVHILRELELYSGSYDPAQFEEINVFYKGIMRSDKRRIYIKVIP